METAPGYLRFLLTDSGAEGTRHTLLIRDERIVSMLDEAPQDINDRSVAVSAMCLIKTFDCQSIVSTPKVRVFAFD